MEKNTTVVSTSVKILKVILDITWYLSWVGAGLALILIIVALSGVNLDQLQVTIPAAIDFYPENTTSEIPYADRPVISEIEGKARILINPERAFWKVLVCIFLPTIIAAFIWGLKHLRFFFLSIKKGNPFDEENPKRLRKLAYLIMIGGPFTGLGLIFQSLFILDDLSVPAGEIELHPDLFLEYVVGGLIILVIAEVFDAAVRMKKEQDLTI